MKTKFFLSVFSISLLISCSKPQPVNLEEMSAGILNDVSQNVVEYSFRDLRDHSVSYQNSVAALLANSNTANLEDARTKWRELRAVWEQCEGFLWGPVSTGGYDPHTDTWPVNWVDMNALMASNVTFNDSLIDNLDDALKGYHPMEYMLWGKNGNKTAADLTSREKEYLQALSQNTARTIAALYAQYDLSQSTSYLHHIIHAGNQTSWYASKRAAFEELVNGMSGICEEVAGGKIEEPFSLQDPSKEESPFSKNSLTDFANNIRSVQNLYNGKYRDREGKGIADFVKETNASLNNKIQSQLNTAIASLEVIPVPFGEAILTHQSQLLQAQKAINDLHETLEDELLPLVQQKVK
ncbi:MAG: imelysin family protein [Chitinophagales bacterium]